MIRSDEIAKRLSDLRKQTGATLAELAAETGISQEELIALETPGQVNYSQLDKPIELEPPFLEMVKAGEKKLLVVKRKQAVTVG